MAGKNKLTRGVTISIDDSGGTPRDLSGDLVPGSLTGMGFTAGEVDMTGESNTVGNFLADRRQNTLTARFHANDTATTGASTVLHGILQAVGTVTISIGSAGAAPTTGDLKFSGEFVCLDVKMVQDGGKLVHEVTLRPGTSTAPAWGTV
jgi:hypothetical protein